MKENNDSEEWIDIVMRIEDKKEKVKNLFCVDSFVSCVIQFPVSVSRDLIFSVSLGLRIIQLFDLVYRLAD